jgi:thiamine pyrophosphate-dependent acetolactate synthase large subunit-like protein
LFPQFWLLNWLHSVPPAYFGAPLGGQHMRVVDAIATWFGKAGVQHYFGYAGGAVWPFLDALWTTRRWTASRRRSINAVHMADIYWRTTGRIAPVIVTKGGPPQHRRAMATTMHDTSAVLLLAGAAPPTSTAGRG